MQARRRKTRSHGFAVKNFCARSLSPLGVQGAKISGGKKQLQHRLHEATRLFEAGHAPEQQRMEVSHTCAA